MVLIQIAGYILAITVVLTLASRLMWLLFGLFLFRSFNALIPIETLQLFLPAANSFIYFTVLALMSAGVYFTVMKLTRELEWVRYVILFILTIWVFRHYSLADLLLFKDWLSQSGYWQVEYWTGQAKEVFTGGPDGISSGFLFVFESVMGFLKGLWEGLQGL